MTAAIKGATQNLERQRVAIPPPEELRRKVLEQLINDKAQLQLLEKPGHLFLFTAEMIDFTQKNVQGFGQHPTTTLWNYQNVWLQG